MKSQQFDGWRLGGLTDFAKAKRQGKVFDQSRGFQFHLARKPDFPFREWKFRMLIGGGHPARLSLANSSQKAPVSPRKS